jgi:hypothetical protein
MVARRLASTTLFATIVGPLLTGAVACGGSDGGSPADPPAASEAPSDACPAPGFRGAADEACVVGGWAACAEGTKPRASGWGCEAIVPAHACTGATRDVFGSDACAPVGDCSAPFPPADATLFVAANGPIDATHFTRIGDAIAAAPAGAVIAIGAGTYRESLLVQKDVTLRGKCAAEVSILGFGQSVRGIRVEAARATVSGVTFAKQFIGASVGPGAALAISDSVFDGNSEVGLSLSEGQATLDAERIVVRDTAEGPGGQHGQGINAQSGAEVHVTDSAFSGNHYANIRLSTGAKGTLDRVVSRDGQPSTTEDAGRGLSVQDGASATVTRSAFVDQHEIAIVAGDRATVDLTDVFVGGTRLAKSGEFGRALNAFGGAEVHATRFHAYDNHDASVMVAEAGTHVTLESSSVVDTGFDEGGYVGRAITAQEGAAVDVVDTAVAVAREVAIAVFSPGTRATLKRSIVIGTLPNAGDYFGHGAMATLGGLLEIEDSEIASNTGTGIAIGDAAARLARVRIRGNAVGLYVQDGTTLRETSDGAAAAPPEREVDVSTDTVFLSNGTRVSSGVVALPEPLKQ